MRQVAAQAPLRLRLPSRIAMQHRPPLAGAEPETEVSRQRLVLACALLLAGTTALAAPPAISVETVKAHLFRARKKLQEQLAGFALGDLEV